MVAAALRQDSADVANYAQVLTATLADVLPAGCVTVDRARSLGDKLKGRDGHVRRIVVRLGERSLSLTTDKGRPIAEVCHEVRGVILKREQIGLDAWLDALAQELVTLAGANANAAEALRRLIG
ncbi:MAG: hypothetical protein JWN00_4134 [Actinomycetia bacterium]|jgi:hypothetical protein|nr:hypothetical protein [Actinomycetes bacterium]